MRRDPGDIERHCCVACGYDLRGHAAQPGRSWLSCPECGGVCSVAESLAAARRGAGFRWWMTPLFLLPAVALVILESISSTGLARDPAVRVGMLVALFVAAHLALRDRSGAERVGAAAVLANALLVTNGLLASLC